MRLQQRDPLTGESVLAITKIVTKMVVPDVTAQIFWLKNRKPVEWRDKQLDTNADKDVNVVLGEDVEGLAD